MRMKYYWLFTSYTGTKYMLSDVLVPTRVLYVKTKSTEKCEIFAVFESRVKLRLKEFDM